MRGYFEDLYNEDTKEQVAVYICDFGCVRRGNYFGRKPVERTEVEERMIKLKNGKATSKDKVTGEMINRGD